MSAPSSLQAPFPLSYSAFLSHVPALEEGMHQLKHDYIQKYLKKANYSAAMFRPVAIQEMRISNESALLATTKKALAYCFKFSYDVTQKHEIFASSSDRPLNY